MRRVGGDIGDDFGSVYGEFHNLVDLQQSGGASSGPGYWNDLGTFELLRSSITLLVSLSLFAQT
jgi:hypothetical protein